MNIDERIERLAERHEALAQTVELLTIDVREVTAGIRTLRDSVTALLRIAELHEQRLTNLDGGGA